MASSSGEGIKIFDAFFTAVSAICVTGLTVVDTQTQWSFFGELIILLLVLIGGLGYIAGIGVVLWIFGRSFGLRDRHLMRLYYGAPSLGEGFRFMRSLLIYAFGIQVIGFVVLSAVFLIVHEMPFGRAIWWGAFHAVSAFNCSGFNITGNDMVLFASDPEVLIPVGLLVFAGSIGSAAVVLSLFNKRVRQVPLQVKLILYSAVGLVALGSLFFGVSEWNNPSTLATVDVSHRPVLAFFQTITWTSGFSAINAEFLNDWTKFFSSVLMLIGGAAGSPAGGIKLATVAVLFASLFGFFRGREDVAPFGRRIPKIAVYQAATITLIFLAILFLETFLLMLLSDFRFADVLYDATSALATVGWSTGLTSEFNSGARVVLICGMLLGRFLPIILVLIMFRQRLRSTFRAQRDSIRIG
tara:strand:+ start:11917 stop:13152 length:1236 start_codon:yes stop_codon:yes gene_type:complete